MTPNGMCAGGLRRLTLLESLRCSSAVAGDLALGSAPSLDGPLPDVASMLAPVVDEASTRPPLMLQNKLPRWNEGKKFGSCADLTGLHRPSFICLRGLYSASITRV